MGGFIYPVICDKIHTSWLVYVWQHNQLYAWCPFPSRPHNDGLSLDSLWYIVLVIFSYVWDFNSYGIISPCPYTPWFSTSCLLDLFVLPCTNCLYFIFHATFRDDDHWCHHTSRMLLTAILLSINLRRGLLPHRLSFFNDRDDWLIPACVTIFKNGPARRIIGILHLEPGICFPSQY